MEETITIKTPSGVHLAGITEREASNNNSALVVMCHGFSSGKNSKTNKRFVQELLKRGFAAFRFDFRGHYDSEGLLEDVTISSGVEDLSAVMQYIKNLRWVNQDRIGILSTSYGAIVSIVYVAINNNVRTMALKSPIFDYLEVRERQLGIEGIQEWKEKGYAYVDGDKTNYLFYEDAKKLDISSLAKRINIPCLIVHGSADENVPLSQSIKLTKTLSGETKLEVIEGADHQYKKEEHFDQMVQPILDWFSRKL